MRTFTYTMSFAAAREHSPAHPERTARKDSGEWDVQFRVWMSRAAMARSIRTQERAGTARGWRACVPLESNEGW